MAKTPFYKVSIRNTNNQADDRDISALISRFSYEDATDVDNLLTLELSANASSLLDDPIFAEGSYLTFQWGFLKGKISNNFISRIANITTNYDSLITITIQATDLGILLKKSESKKDWKNLKGSDIAKSIATYYGLKAVVDDSETVHAFMPQGGKTDYNFLKYLSKIQKSGSWRFYIKNDVLYFTKLNLQQGSFKTYNYNDGDGEVLSFRPYSRETSKNNAARSTVVTSVDPFTNKPVQKVINDKSSSDDVKLGDFPVHVYNGDGKEISAPSKNNQQKRPSQVQLSQKDPDRANSHIYQPTDEDEIENIGNSEKKQASMHEYLADLEAEGDPDVLSDLIITMGNVSKRDIGNWFVTRAKHVIDSASGYILHLTLNKNAAQKAGAGDNNTKNDSVNKTVGTKDAETKKSVGVYTYDGNGRELSAPSK